MQRLLNWRPLRKKKYVASEIDFPSVNGTVFDLGMLSEGFFVGGNRVNCAVWIDSGQSIAYGTDTGVFVHRLDESPDPTKLLNLKKVSHIGVFEELRLLIVRTKQTVFTYSLERARSLDRDGLEQSGKKLASDVTFLTLGECLGRRMLCIVKAEKLSSTLNLYHAGSGRDVFGPQRGGTRRGGSQTGGSQLGGSQMGGSQLGGSQLGGSQVGGSQRSGSRRGSQELMVLPKNTPGKLMIFKEFYISTRCYSVTLLKTQLCLGCTSGFEIVDLKTSETHALLDPKDSALKFVRRREDVNPHVIYRVGEGFLLCYTHFAFYVNKSGRLMQRKPIISWDNISTSCTLEYPYLIVFKPRYMEIYNVEDGMLSQVIRGDNFRPVFEEHIPNHNPAGPPFDKKHSVLASDDQVITLHALTDEIMTLEPEVLTPGSEILTSVPEIMIT